MVNTFDILLFLSPCTFTQFTNFFWWLTVPGSISKKPRSRNIFSSFFCCFGAQSTAAGSPCTTVSHSNHNHNHNDNSITDKTDSKVGISVRRFWWTAVHITLSFNLERGFVCYGLDLCLLIFKILTLIYPRNAHTQYPLFSLSWEQIVSLRLQFFPLVARIAVERSFFPALSKVGKIRFSSLSLIIACTPGVSWSQHPKTVNFIEETDTSWRFLPR